MSAPSDWAQRFKPDIQYGFVGELDFISDRDEPPRRYGPDLVLNGHGSTVEHALLDELSQCERFTFSVAFVSPGAIAQLKQRLLDFNGSGLIVTSDFLGFNQPRAFAELLKIQELTGVAVRRHTAKGFHPKGYIFERAQSVTAMIGSSNLTSSALSKNHEWNLRVSAARGSDLAQQIGDLLDDQVKSSEPITQEWIDAYAAAYVAPPKRQVVAADPAERQLRTIEPNQMQQDALLAIDLERAQGATRAIVVSATGTGKTILAALDVRHFKPNRMLFLVHREQILDKSIEAFQQVIGGPSSDFGKVSGGVSQLDRKYVFATVQSLSRPQTLCQVEPDAFDYVLIDEAHRAGADTYRSVIDHLTPKFLLGMTATPERTDGFNVFELFDYNVPYEIRLNHALEADMLSPFHYYGIADVTYEDGSTPADETDLKLLITPDRVNHLIEALDRYGQAGTEPRGLIFCSRKEEARDLSRQLNQHSLRGKPLRTVALTGEDSIAERERRVSELETGQLDYILTIDVFNEGVDIPTVNQVVMLRQTQSAIVFVQQLGRGLRLAENKDHLVVIDFIGNYTNNFLIPIALFGDETLNRESLREKLNETVDGPSLPGLSSVSFDEISRKRILASIDATKLNSFARLKSALIAMQHRVGKVPQLWDFHRFESVDPVLLATSREHYPALVEKLLGIESRLSTEASRALHFISYEVLPAKRLHELVLLELLVERRSVNLEDFISELARRELPSDALAVSTSLDSLCLRGYNQTDENRYQSPIAIEDGDKIKLAWPISNELDTSAEFAEAVADVLKTGMALTSARYDNSSVFTPAMQYSRRDAARVVGWGRKSASTVYGYKTDTKHAVATIFVTLHKSDEVEASTAYEDALLDPSHMRWFSKSNRTLKSKDVAPIVAGEVALHVFVKKDDSEGPDHYYLGRATAHDAVKTTMPGSDQKPLPVVAMTLKFDQPIKQGLFDYFHTKG
ncbi:MAG TPA: DEAD/DEAH box helicase [Aeromicrobium sp.]|nr:DEAD/DEAH box helicase [Aeromicrobium sp.]